MEKSIFKVTVLWVAIMCGFALHTLADLLPLFWGADIAIDASGSAPTGLLMFMMVVSYLVPAVGILCCMYGGKRAHLVANGVLATFMLLFNLFHSSELFTGFNAVQLPILPAILVVSGFLCHESWKLTRKRCVPGTMREKMGLFDRFLQNAAHPRGFWGRMLLRGMNRFHAMLSAWAMTMVDWQAEWNVLDVGCGGGANVSSMLRLCHKGKVYGVDISEESVRFARRHNRRWMDSRCFIRQGDACHLPYDDGQFDVVTAFETVYFWQDLPKAFGEVARVLRPDGMFLICCEACNPDNDVWTSRIEHMRVYSPAELEAQLRDAGFAGIAIQKRHKEDLCIVAHKGQVPIVGTTATGSAGGK